MKKIKLFLEFVASDKSQFIQTMTIQQLAEMFGKNTYYILDLELYLKDCQENGGDNGPEDPFWKMSNTPPLEEYKFHLEENYPSYLEDDSYEWDGTM
jgi:hypothetical protein